LDAIKQTDPYFNASYILQINQTVERFPGKDLTKEFLNGVEITRFFKQIYRQKTVQRDPTSKAGFFRSKFQSEDAPSGSKSNQKCIDGFKGYTPKKCYIFNKRFRPDGWKVLGKHAKDILEALEANKTLKKRYNSAYKKVTALLYNNSNKSIDTMKRVVIRIKVLSTSFVSTIYPFHDSTI